MVYLRYNVLSIIVAIVWLSGCVSETFGTEDSTPDSDNKTSDNIDSNLIDTSEVGSDSDTQNVKEPFILDGDYSAFSSADDTWAPSGEPMLLTKTHPGWKNARCFDCHGQGKRWEPENHNPKMQYWAWSCSRGFPGGSCHGHDKNGASWFNHDGDPAFDNCTQSGCHDTYDTVKEFENHGFTNTPDSFCNACHDYYWDGWPAKKK